MPSLKDIMAQVKANEASTAPAVPAKKPSLNDLMAKHMGTAAPAAPAAQPAPTPPPAPPADPMAALASLDVTADPAHAAAANAAEAAAQAPVVHTAITEASYRYSTQAEAAPEAEMHELWSGMAAVTEALSKSAAGDQTPELSFAIKRVLEHIQSQPQLAGVLLPDDIGVMTKALEASYAVTIVKKADNKKKRTTKKAAATPSVEMAADLAALGFAT